MRATVHSPSRESPAQTRSFAGTRSIKDLIDEARVFHFGTLSLTDEPARTATQQAVAYAKANRQAHHLRPQSARAALANRGGGKRADALEPCSRPTSSKSATTRFRFSGAVRRKKARNGFCSEFDVKLAMVTLGADGCLLQTKATHASARLLQPYIPSTPPVRAISSAAAPMARLSGFGESAGRAHAGRPFLYRNLRTHGRESFYRALRRYSEHPGKRNGVI